jgi:hypothetical protein
MAQQSYIYIAFAICGLALVGYALERSNAAWHHSGMSSLFAIMAVVALLFAALTAFYTRLALLFARRSVGAISQVAGGFLLEPSKHCGFKPVLAADLKLRRQIGEQFSKDENEPKYVLFAAAGRLWVCDRIAYQAAKQAEPTR